MKIKLIPLLSCSVLMIAALQNATGAASLVIDWKNAPGYELKNQIGTPLSSGVSNLAGDGTALELGYYSLATTSSPFQGEWIAFTGQSIPKPRGQTTTIGDKLVGVDGLFDIHSQFNTEFDTFVEGAVGHPLSIRFYNQTPSTTPSLFNAVSSPDWVLQALSEDSVLQVSLDLSSASGLQWQGGQAANTVFRTVLPIPEPSGVLLLGLSTLGLLFRRR